MIHNVGFYSACNISILCQSLGSDILFFHLCIQEMCINQTKRKRKVYFCYYILMNISVCLTFKCPMVIHILTLIILFKG